MSKTYNSDKIGSVTIPESDKPAQAHTPGPWRIDGTDWINTPDAGGYRVQLVNGANFTIAHVQVDEDDTEQQANARLIVAAPDLLAACKAVAGVFEGQEDMPLYARKCTAAIAKAEGRAQ